MEADIIEDEVTFFSRHLRPGKFYVCTLGQVPFLQGAAEKLVSSLARNQCPKYLLVNNTSLF
jgi:hypothetical protein